MPGEVRRKAIQLLTLVERGLFAERVISSFLEKEGGLKREDRNLVSEIVFGVLRNRMFLDAVLSRFTKKPLHKTESFTRNALRVGAYQILFLDRVPTYAAVNETVEAVKGERGPKMAGFVNGVLKRVSAADRQMLAGDMNTHILHSIPGWIAKHIFHYFPEDEAACVMAHFAKRPERYVRFVGREGVHDPGRHTRIEGIGFHPHPRLDGLYRIEPGVPLEEMKVFREGWVVMQDPGSYYVARLVASVVSGSFPAQGKFLDACAAPGIKASLLRERLDSWEMHVNEPSPGRSNEMRKNFRRMHLAGFSFHEFDFEKETPREMREAFDVVFVDTPCSGLGVMRRNPEVKWRVEEEDVSGFAAKSSRILENALACLKGGGVCFYATCTLTPEENEGVVESVAAGTGFEVISLAPHIDREISFLYDGMYLVTRPHRLDGDFFFLAMLGKEGKR